ncbi:hypothetical protein [Chryseobacterium sp. AG363]|uniref:hypothetical protein n=1 Tax=Chryseobacterium sp. AG363 TaxID=2183997 RepID=UPI000E75EC87|nr:hypothetical protein [Chryseobacterium sp. AG363]RKE77167.1 hypothetical protein DEU39_3929 [Chryseobacterium sp. AG363]
MKNLNIQTLVGKSKTDIMAELGFEFNHFPAKEWTYHISTNKLGFKTILKIVFENDKVKTATKYLKYKK